MSNKVLSTIFHRHHHHHHHHHHHSLLHTPTKSSRSSVAAIGLLVCSSSDQPLCRCLLVVFATGYSVFPQFCLSPAVFGLSLFGLLLLGCVTHQVRYSSSRCRSLSPSLAAKGLSFFDLLLLKRFVYLVAVALLLAAKRLWSLAFQARCSSDVPVVALHPGACRPVTCRQSHLVSTFGLPPFGFLLLVCCSCDVSMIALHPGDYRSFARGKTCLVSCF